MTCSEFSAKRATRRQSPIDVSSSALPNLPVSSSLVAVVPRTIIRSPRSQPGKFVSSDPERVLQHYPLQSGHRREQHGGLFKEVTSNHRRPISTAVDRVTATSKGPGSGRNCLQFTPKWIGRYNWRDVKLLLRSWLWNAIARINRPSVIFTNQHRSHWRLCAGASGFGYMRNAQKKKDHEYCAAHFSFISTNTLATKSVRALVTPC
jgi:hypothetical protein